MGAGPGPCRGGRRGPDGALGQRIAGIVAARPPLSPKDLALDGSAIMQTLGVGPSPAVGEATRFLLDHVLDRPDLNTPDQLRALLRNRPG
jgi:tRNA nucleotidyltransferase (CCA-adding enzyme)